MPSVRFAPNSIVLGFGVEYEDLDSCFFRKSAMEIIQGRTAIKMSRRENNYLIFENDPDFEELERLTKEITGRNIELLEKEKEEAQKTLD